MKKNHFVTKNNWMEIIKTSNSIHLYDEKGILKNNAGTKGSICTGIRGIKSILQLKQRRIRF